MRTTSWFLFAILFSASALYFSPNLEWSLHPLTPEIESKAITVVPKPTSAPRATSSPALRPAEVAQPKPANSAVVPRPTPTPAEPKPAQGSPSASPIPTATEDSQIAQGVFIGSNDKRMQEGLAALQWDEPLAAIARSHSADMLTHEYFSHEDQNGCGSSCRADNAHYAWMAIGENIYMTEGYKLSSAAEAEMVVAGWMNSPGHRANILGAQFTHSGVGVAVQGDKVYVTAMYSNPR